MANKHLTLKPMGIDKNNWYYEMPGYIELIHVEPHETLKQKTTTHVKISWRKLRASLGRKDRKL